jgi:dTDP-4-amino-4,6-dideoxygalactose transaminase
VPFLELDAGYRELRAELDDTHRRVLERGWYILGEEVEAFEQEFAAYCGTDHCVAVGNGLDALTLLLRAHGFGPGDEVIVPGHTAIATWLAVSATGATPVAADVRPDTCNLDPDSAAAAVTSRTVALLPVHLYGQPADVVPLRRLAERHGLVLLEDAAQGHGALYQGQRVGSLGAGAGFSFYPTKNLGAFGDGGAVTTSDRALADKVRLLRNYGSRVKYQHECIGVNSRLDELQAAFLRVKLRRLDEWNRRRAKLAALYAVALRGVPDVTLPTVLPETEPVWHLHVVRLRNRTLVEQQLKRAGVGTLVHYPIPPHLSGAYREGGWRGGPLPVTERLAEEVLSLPMSPHLSAADVLRVAEAMTQAGDGLRLAG